ncbi:small-conductance mechanosensitive channel [Inquilinus ginsengisoli]|uniref:Small-conductance mechanosensitive channel n=1 Tax=Inquilinus ginsengisoli TaxID=363840 RepID=A0ABU1JNL7_9PROT|nr:hypothetical protein [Inquilinus ginsengisoli]MDR6290203.1 small-conductance mechanosensitive channel [Inquilinus ginsengisoli]
MIDIVTGVGRFLLYLVVALVWALALALGYSVMSCGNGDMVAWALLLVLYAGFILWPLALLAAIGALIATVRYRPFRDGASARRLLHTVVAVALVLAFIGVAFGFGEPGSCGLGGF